MKKLIKQTLLFACLILFFTQCVPSKKEISEYRALAANAEEYCCNPYEVDQLVLFEDLNHKIDTFVCMEKVINLKYESEDDRPFGITDEGFVGSCGSGLYHISQPSELFVQFDLYAAISPYNNVTARLNYHPDRDHIWDGLRSPHTMLRLPSSEDTIVCKENRQDNPMYAILKKNVGLIEWGYEDGNKWKLVK